LEEIMSKSARKQIESAIDQCDAALTNKDLTGKPVADILGTKAQLVLALVELDKETVAEKIVVLEAGQLAASAKIAGLTEQLSVAQRDNATLKIQASTPQTITVSDPQTAVLREQRDALEYLLTRVIESLSPEGRLKVAVKIASSCEPETVEQFARIAKLDHDALVRYGTADRVDLVRMAQGQDAKVSPIVRAWLAYRFPPDPIKQSGAPTGWIEDHRSGPEKLAAAKAMYRPAVYSIGSEPS
jgi:hypothetical protein